MTATLRRIAAADGLGIAVRIWGERTSRTPLLCLAGLVRTGGTQFGIGQHPFDWKPFRGSTDKMVRTMHAFADLGLRNYRATPSPCTLETLEQFGEVIRAFDRG